MNIEQGILNIDFTSSFNIPCSIFDIPLGLLYLLQHKCATQQQPIIASKPGSKNFENWDWEILKLRKKQFQNFPIPKFQNPNVSLTQFRPESYIFKAN